MRCRVLSLVSVALMVALFAIVSGSVVPGKAGADSVQGDKEPPKELRGALEKAEKTVEVFIIKPKVPEDKFFCFCCEKGTKVIGLDKKEVTCKEIKKGEHVRVVAHELCKGKPEKGPVHQYVGEVVFAGPEHHFYCIKGRKLDVKPPTDK
jgi:hypothetical protein